jgi:hypothetical protein
VIGLACGLLLMVGCFMYVFAPIRQLAVPHGERKSRLEFLHERKDVIYENLRDLNFEYKAGKFPEADFLSLRNELEREAAAVLAEIDDLQRSIEH